MSTFTTIGALASGLPNKYGNRQDLAIIADGSKPITAIRQSIAELTETYEFEELKYQTPVPPSTPLQMTTSQPIIPIESLLATIAGNTSFPQFQTQNVVDITDVYTFWMWFSGGVNQAGRTLDYRRVPTVDQDSYGITSNTQGAVGTAPPTYFTRFNNILQVGPAPDNPYTFFVRMKLRHPLPITEPFSAAVLIPTVAGGQITGVSVLSGGSGYLPLSSNIPMTFNTPVGGSPAKGTATVNNSGAINGVNLTNEGLGYTSNNVTTCSTAVIASQSVFMPDSWYEIVQYAACWRLATWAGEQDYIVMFDNILKSKGIDVAEARAAKSQMKRDERHNSRQISLRLGSPYTFANR
jgi:hypothetical protein